MTTPTNRVVVVTGASAGVGRATVREFARNGDHIALLARGEAGLAAAAHDVETIGGVALPIGVDVAEPRSSKQPPNELSTNSGLLTYG
jgi:NADP-dependent 3-hydroxy acid dehydrogenase YdfG